MKKRALSICLCLGITIVLFAGCGCGSADQKKAARENTEAVQETGTEALSRLMDNTEEATEVAEVTETTEASETSDPAAPVDASAEASASGNDAAASGSTAKADTNKSAKSGSKSDSNSGSASQASQPAVASGSAKVDNTTQAAAPAQTQASSAQPASQPAAHEHHWEQYLKDTIDHPEVGHYETKVVQAAYDEPQYDWHYICNKCGLDMGTDENKVDYHYAFDCDGSYRSDLVQVGSIHHDAVTEQVYVVDQAAWTEQVYGYRCSCGATK